MTSSDDPPAVSAVRDDSIDILRGLIVALMALDHVRIFFSAAQFDPTDLARTDLGYFATRWATHLCAPGFFFLAGLSAGLFERQASKREVSLLLLTRGAMLVVMEVLVFGLAWSFHWRWWWFGVIAGLGASMIALAGLIHLPRAALLIGAVLFTLLHNWVASSAAPQGTLAALLYSGGLAQLPGMGPRIILYSVLPWLALMVLGYAVAAWIARTDPRAASHQLWVGVAAVVLFVLFRAIGWGQSMSAEAAANSSAATFMQFMNVEKYPPSLQFSLATLGLCLILLAALRRFGDTIGSPVLRPLLIYGRVPLFFYLLHLFLIHGAALATALLLGWPTSYLFWSPPGPNLRPPDGYGFTLPGVYLTWLAVLVALLPLCAAYARYKRQRRSWWLKLL